MTLRLFYTAKATHPPFTYHDLDIMREAIAFNTANAINGLLLRSDRSYFQILEGAEADVRALANRIKRDPRLFAYQEICADVVPQRMFDTSPFEFQMLEHEDRDLIKRLTMLRADSSETYKQSLLRYLASLYMHQAPSAA